MRRRPAAGGDASVTDTAGRWLRVREVLWAVLQEEAPRQLPLARRLCGDDPSLLAEVMSLVESDEAAGTFLAAPLPHAAPGPGLPHEPPPERIGPYRVVRALEPGGMSVVVLAERDDEVFRKRVAIKLLRASMDAAGLQRFVLERQTLAGLEHPNIARILDGGALPDGRPFLVMEYVEGERIDVYCREHALGLKERLRIFVKLCDAVHAAHGRLLVHGDVKPANVLVGWDGEPKLIDFGISVPVEDRSSAAGFTPGYASPEHVAGEPLTPASDVYSLGLVLRDLITGAVEGPRLRRLLRGDLGWILKKAQAPDPAQRYGSAQELARDVRSFLAVAPVAAAPRTLRCVLAKTIRRNPVAAAMALLAVVAVAAGAVAHGLQRREAELTARYDRVFSDYSREVLEIRRRQSMLPIGESGSHTTRIQALMDTVSRELEQAGPLARGPAELALGSGAFALGRYGEAYRHFQAAGEAGYESPRLSLLTARTLWSLYLEAAEDVEATADEAERRARLEELDERYRRPALAHLRKARSTNPDERRYVSALIAFSEGEYRKAGLLARRVFAESPWLYEAKQLEAETAVAQALQAARQGRIDRAEDLLTRAGKAYDQALAVGRSDPALWAGACRRSAELFDLRPPLPGTEDAAMQRVLDPCRTAVGIDPGMVAPWITLARTYWRVSEYLVTHDRDPAMPVRRALDAARTALDLDPRSSRAWQYLGMTAAAAATWELHAGGDPVPWLGLAQEAYERALSLAPREARLYNNRANLHLRWAEHHERLGRDPFPRLRLAVADYGRALELDPQPKYRMNLRTTLAFEADLLRGRGRPPAPSEPP